MVIVRLTGGLGNQMFQYAAGRAIALRRRTSLKLDISSYEEDHLRSYSLGYFPIVECFAGHSEVEWLTRPRIYGRRHLPLLILERWGLWHRPMVFRQGKIGFQPALLQTTKHCYLAGYWQSADYFADCESQIRSDFTFREPLSSAAQNVAAQIDEANSVSLHVRRGDCATDPVVHRNHGLCSLEYYQRSLDLMAQTVPHASFFVFSDDLDWAAQNLQHTSPIQFVRDAPASDAEDLRLMSLCKHHIIANSSFSWWGAWLSVNPAKRVIAPKRWFAAIQADTSRLIPDGWKRL